MRNEFSESDSRDADFGSAAYGASTGTSDHGSLSTREWKERADEAEWKRKYMRGHTMTLLADHHDGQWKEYLGGNPYGETGREKDSRKEKDGRREVALAN